MISDLYPLQTERLNLRQVQPGDLDTIHSYQKLPEVARYCMWEPRTRDEVAERMPRWIAMNGEGEKSEGVSFSITLKDGGKMIGDCQIMFTDKPARQAEVGYVLHPDYHRKGYASEAVGALLKLSFGPLNLHRVFARCDASNIGSWKVMEKLGMRREAHFREHALFKGEWDEEFYYAILEDEWRAKEGER